MKGENISKKIIISGSTPIMITFDEVYQKYQNLLRKKVHSWSNTYEYEELYQVPDIVLHIHGLIPMNMKNYIR